jgi:NitT/TauT family transport system substrate-binding protein
MRTKPLVIASAAIALLLAGCSSSGDAATTPDATAAGTVTPVDLRLDWTWGAQHLGYLAAEELGYFADEGLDVTIAEGEGSAVTGTVVGTGDSAFGVMAAGEVLAASSKGLGVQSIYTVLQSNPTAFVYNKDKLDLESPEDLAGHTLGVSNQSTTYKEYQALAELTGLDVSGISEVAIGAQLVPAMLSDQVDAIVAFSNSQYPQLLLEGKNVGVLRFTDAGMPDIPSATVVVNTDFAKENPDTVSAFVSAVDRGWKWVAENQDEALEMLATTHPEVDPQFAAEALPLVLDLMGETEDFGTFNEESWQNLLDLYQTQGLLGAPVELESVYDSEYLG